MTKHIFICLVLATTLIFACNSKAKQQTDSYGTSPLKESMQRGKAVYNDMCITCHMPNGEGVPKAFPPLADSDYLEQHQTESIRAVKYGMSGEIVVNGTTYNSIMSPLGLSDEEVADVMNYINNSWGNSYSKAITPEEVIKVSKK